MIFRQEILSKIKKGEIQVAFRKWKSPRVKVNGTLVTSIGVLKFSRVEEVKLSSLSDKDAQASGHKDLKDLKKELSLREGKIFKIAFKRIGPDPRESLREKKLSNLNEFESLKNKLERLDRFSEKKWTRELLGIIKDYPGVGSKTLSEKVNMKQDRFKLNVRKLKNLGLTISLGTGYKLSPRGKDYYRKIQKDSL